MRSDVPSISFLLRTFGFAALAGMRSFSPPALLSLYLSRQVLPPGHSVAQWLKTPSSKKVIVGLALAELAADKLPNAPNRTFLPALIGRAFTGGGASALLWSLKGHSAWIGGLGGAVASVGNTYLTFYLRQWLSRALPLPNAVSLAGVIEDAVLLTVGWQLLQGATEQTTTEE
jgi:uncharacterized membrane protein